MTTKYVRHPVQGYHVVVDGVTTGHVFRTSRFGYSYWRGITAAGTTDREQLFSTRVEAGHWVAKTHLAEVTPTTKWVHSFRPGDDVFHRPDLRMGTVLSVEPEQVVVILDPRFGKVASVGLRQVTWHVSKVCFSTAKPRRKNPVEVTA